VKGQVCNIFNAEQMDSEDGKMTQDPLNKPVSYIWIQLSLERVEVKRQV
jgi:hypothetical protein